MDIYREEILDHYKNPRNFGPASRGVQGKGWKAARETNASCGDVMEIGVKIKEGKIKEIKFSGEGCAISMAAGSMLTEMVKSKNLEQVSKITDKEMVKRLGIDISITRKKCATLGLVTLKKALRLHSG